VRLPPAAAKHAPPFVRSALVGPGRGGRSAAPVVVAALAPSALVGTASAVACEHPRTPEAVRLPASLRMGAAPVEGVVVAVGAGVIAVPEKK